MPLDTFARAADPLIEPLFEGARLEKTPRFPRKRDRLRQRAGAFVVDNAFLGLARLGGALPHAAPRRHAVERVADVAYVPGGHPDQVLDVYRPQGGPIRGTALYIHGGGFRKLSKDTHWLMGLAFARRGYVAFLPSYRLAPEHPFPTAVEDAALAYRYVVENAHRYGGDAERLVVAGESAGANLALAVTLAAAEQRAEPWARPAGESGVVPKACVPFCGILQVSEPERLFRTARRPFIRDRFLEIADEYLDRSPWAGTPEAALADPLVVVERYRAAPPLPPFFVPVGGRDHLEADCRRLVGALGALGVPAELKVYPEEIHAFHAFVWRARARECWRDVFAFVERALPPA